ERERPAVGDVRRVDPVRGEDGGRGADELHRREVGGGAGAREHVEHHQVRRPGRDAGERGAGVADGDLDARAVGGQPGGHEVDQARVQLDHALRRPGAGGGDVAGQRPGAAAEVQRADRLGRRGDQVGDVGQPADVLELQVGGVVEVDVRLCGAVEQQGPALRAVGVADEL